MGYGGVYFEQLSSIMLDLDLNKDLCEWGTTCHYLI